LTIVRVERENEREVWTYTEERAAEAAQSPDLLHQFGFDVTRWSGPPTHQSR